jgi:glycosyltransferase involved in cell wall biosynthesis
VPSYIHSETPAFGWASETTSGREGRPTQTTMPLLSIIIAVYNDWIALDSCLRSIAQQAGGLGFEVIVVDDGSSDVAPEVIREWAHRFSLTIVRQSHAGISVARNRGIQISSGSTLLFVDADCRLQTNCLAALQSIIAVSPQHNYFQLRLIGDCARIVGRSEQLRLTTLQNHLLQPHGCIRYLNTAGFAVRRSNAQIEKGLFEPVALRGEDTLLLATLIQRGDLPFFVADAIVQHAVPLSLLRCFRKDIRSAFLEGTTYAIIASRGVRIRMSHRERLDILRAMWESSKQPLIGRSACFVLTVRQSLSRISSLVYRLLRGRSDLPMTNSALETRL